MFLVAFSFFNWVINSCTNSHINTIVKEHISFQNSRLSFQIYMTSKWFNNISKEAIVEFHFEITPFKRMGRITVDS